MPNLCPKIFRTIFTFNKNIYITLMVLGLTYNYNINAQSIDNLNLKNREEIILDLRNKNLESEDILFIQKESKTEETEKKNFFIDNFSYAVQTKNYQKMEELLKNGTNINQVIYDGNTIVNISSFHQDPVLLSFAIKKKANLKNINKNGESILYWGATGDGIEYLEAVKKAIPPKDFNDLMSKKTNTGRTPLHAAVLYTGNPNVINWLINNKVDMDVKDINGQTALHYAASLSRWDALETLLKRGGNIKETDKNGKTVEDYILENINIFNIDKVYNHLSTNGKKYVDSIRPTTYTSKK